MYDDIYYLLRDYLIRDSPDKVLRVERFVFRLGRGRVGSNFDFSINSLEAQVSLNS
jgi:hypothetical protein